MGRTIGVITQKTVELSGDAAQGAASIYEAIGEGVRGDIIFVIRKFCLKIPTHIFRPISNYYSL